MSPQGLFSESSRLTESELRSLHWVSMVNLRTVVPRQHIEKLVEGGYIREAATGPILTDLGMLRLIYEREKQVTTIRK
jgi:hypothetical protein